MKKKINNIQALEYAIVDIETTGGNASWSRITEIAIIVHDGKEIIDRYETLINPEKNIPLAIFALTGINNEMVRDAPIFRDVANKVFELLEGRVFVAHNVNFDYSFIRHQLGEEGYKWTPSKLCTVRMSRKIKPGFRSYSLGNLCGYLDIPLENRHRAGGDADATAILFSKLMEWDIDGVIPEMLKKTSTDQRFPPNLPPSEFEALPEKPGVYYFHDQSGKVLYVGKAKNIKSRVRQHFTGHNTQPQRQNFLRYVFSVTYETCATELMALLLECIEIKKLWPPYNRALKHFEPKYGLIIYEAMDGYQYLVIGKISKGQRAVQVFNREQDGISLLRSLVQKFGIDHRLCRYGTSYIFSFTDDYMKTTLPEKDVHNELVEELKEYLKSLRPTFAIFDKGRDSTERSCIWVQDGNFYGMGYVANHTDLQSLTDIRDSLTRYYGNHYMMQLIEDYAEKYPERVLKIGGHEIYPEQIVSQEND